MCFLKKETAKKAGMTEGLLRQLTSNPGNYSVTLSIYTI